MPDPRRARRFFRDNGLSLGAGALFLACLVAQAFAGWHAFNNEQHAAGLGTVTLGQYLGSASFAVDVAENWQSEYLQFLVFILMTIWLVQRGSPESKELDKTGPESDEEQKVGWHADPDSPTWAKAGGWRTWAYSWSLFAVMATIFVGSWLAQLVAGWASYNETRLERLQDPLTVAGYFMDADFWSRTLQNWQSEFLAVGSMAIFTVYLRQRGSSQSKPVGAPHDATAVEG
ncbi:MAG: DUF6766 family protein [Nocardioides sp.]